MALETTVNRVQYSGNDSTTLFAFPYYFLADGDLVVIITDALGVETTQTITTHYTVAGAGEAAGGSITMVTAPATGETLTIYRDPSITQPLDLRENDSSPAEAKEEAYDRAAMISQRLDEQIQRSIRLSDGQVGTFDPTLPSDINTPGAFIQVNGAGDGLAAVDALSDSELAIPIGTGVVSRTGATTAALRTITGTANEVAVSDGNGVAGNPVLGLADNPILPGNEAVRFPTGTTGERNGSPTNGDARYNSTTGLFEFRYASAWANFASENSAYRAVNSTDTATVADKVLELSGASFTQTLFTAVGNSGKILDIIHSGTSLTQAYTIDGAGSETIGGSATFILYTNGERLRIMSNGTNWIMLQHEAKADLGTVTLAIDATTTAPTKGTVTTDVCHAYRDGAFLDLNYSFHKTSSGTAGSGTYLWTLPFSLSADSGKITFADGAHLGVVGPAQTFTITTGTGWVGVWDANNLYLRVGNDSNPVGLVDGGYFALNNNPTKYSFTARIPISGWN